MQEALSTEDQWYVLIRDQTYGPLRFDHLAQLANERRILKDDLVWTLGLASWIAAGEVGDLFAEPSRNKRTQSDRNAPAKNASARKSNLKERAKSQIKDFALMFFYLWIIFGLLAAHESIILAQHQIDFKLHGLAFINALVFAKVMLVAEDLHLGRGLEDKPLIYTVLFKSILFAIALICFHLAEHVAVGLWNGRTMAESIAEVGLNKLKGVIAMGMIGTVALAPFFILREVSRVIGEGKLWSLFFQPRNL